MGRRIFARVMAGLLTSSALWTVNAFAQVERPWVWIQAKPSIPKDMLCQPGDYEVFAFRVGCYDVGKGRWKDCETLFNGVLLVERGPCGGAAFVDGRP